MNAALPSLDLRRAEARERFRAKGVPHRRIEEWKYSDLNSAVGANDVEFAEPARWSVEKITPGIELVDLASHEIPDWAVQRLGSLGNPSEMEVASFGFARSGFALRVPREANGELRVSWSRAGQTRVLIVLEQNASLTLMESVDGTLGFRNTGMEIFVADGARCEHTRISLYEARSVQATGISVRLMQDALYRAHFLSLGAKLSRTELHVALEGQNAKTHLSGVNILDDTHSDLTTHVIHAVGDTQSTQLFKYVAGDQSRGVYQGKITVAEGANGSDSRQTAKGLLLRERAEIDLKPELEIYADDVKCAHGAAVGDLDMDSLFYLRSRGILETEARALLIRAFVGDAVEQIESETIRDLVWQIVDDSLENMS